MGDRMHPAKQPPKTFIVLEVPDSSNLDKLLGALAGAINRHADAIAKPGTSLAEVLKSGGNTETLAAISALDKKLDRILQAIDADPETLKQLQSKLSSLTDTLKSAVETQQPK